MSDEQATREADDEDTDQMPAGELQRLIEQQQVPELDPEDLQPLPPPRKRSWLPPLGLHRF